MNYNRNLFRQINRLTNEVTGSYRSYTPPTPPVTEITITQQPQDVTAYPSQAISLSITAVAPEGTELAYQWYTVHKNGQSPAQEIEGATTDTITAPVWNEDWWADGYHYVYCVVSDASGTLDSVTSDNADITWLYGTLSITSFTPSQSAAIVGVAGDTIDLSFTWTSTCPDDVLDSIVWYVSYDDGENWDVLDETDTTSVSFIASESCIVAPELFTWGCINSYDCTSTGEDWTITIST